jgi:hypothetical protein
MLLDRGILIKHEERVEAAQKTLQGIGGLRRILERVGASTSLSAKRALKTSDASRPPQLKENPAPVRRTKVMS